MTPEPSANPVRRPGTAVPGITGLRFMPDRREARLVNISETGLLAESTARLIVGAQATVMFEGGFTPRLATGRVVRCEVAVMGADGLLRYHTGIEFDQPLPLGDDGTNAAVAEAPDTVRNRW